jgi:S-adenosylmethionine/arginine decarboxylase-like enzyme
MASHHFIGKGLTSAELRQAAGDPVTLAATIERLVVASGLSIVERQLARFPKGGMTLVWILAESHLVMHYWAEEGFTTIDLHVCDYDRSNAHKAEALRMSLEEFCFEPGTANWQVLKVADPPSALVGESAS